MDSGSDEDEEKSELSEDESGGRGPMCLIGMVAVVVVCTVIDARTTRYVPTFTEWYITWTEEHSPWSLVLYAFTAIVCILCTIPLGAFVVAAGVLFAAVYGYPSGWFLAAFTMICVDIIAGVLALFIGRYCLRSSMVRLLETDDRFRIVKAVDKLIAVQGVEISVIVKLAPVPAGILGYLLGSTPVSVAHYALGTAIAGGPYILATTFLSASATNWTSFLSTFFSSAGSACCFILVVIAFIVGVVLFSTRLKARYNELLTIQNAEAKTERTLEGAELVPLNQS